MSLSTSALVEPAVLLYADVDDEGGIPSSPGDKGGRSA